MEKLTKNKYIMTEYFQKSLNLLFPILTENKQEGVINTYLFAEHLKEDIIDYYLLCEMDKSIDLVQDLQDLLYASYDIDGEENTELCIFDISSKEIEVDKFLKGSYSEYSQESKRKILCYYSWCFFNPTLNRKEIIPIERVKQLKEANPKFYTFLYPNDFKKEIAIEMTDNLKLYDKKQECLKVLNQIKEFALPYDVELETFKKKIK